MIENSMTAIVVVVFGLLASYGMARKPQFEMPNERRDGANVHWFSLVKDSEAEVRIKQIYFGIGQQFIDAGWNIPNSSFDKLICLVIAQGDIVTVNAKGEQTWSMSFITQGPVGDLYRECWKAVEANRMEWIDSARLVMSPSSPDTRDYANGIIAEMDSFEPLGAFAPRFVIRHEAHPTNPARSMYRMTQFNDV